MRKICWSAHSLFPARKKDTLCAEKISLLIGNLKLGLASYIFQGTKMGI